MKNIFAFMIFCLAICAAETASFAQGTATSSPAAILSEAIKAYESGDGQRTASLLTPLTKAGTANERVYYYLGMVAYDAGDFSTAEAQYRKALTINPKFALPYSELAAIFMSQKKGAEAEGMARQSTILDPTYVTGFVNLGNALLTLRRNDEASQAFLAAAKLDPETVNSQGARMLIQYKDANAALYFLNIVLEVAPENPLALLNAGQAYRMLGNIKAAKEHFKKGYEVTPTQQEPFGVLYSSYFRLLLDSGDYAVIHRDALTKVGPNYPSGQWFVALAYYKEGKMELFEESAKMYFLLQKEQLPPSLREWAKEHTDPQDTTRK